MSDKICAIATPYGTGPISIIRTSGEGSIELVNQIFKGKDLLNVESHTIHYGNIVYENEIIDEVMVSVFLPPRTYTKEESVEINCHGGLFVTNKILGILLKIGFRLAEPGEFTKRAFLNGRIDLTQAEAVMDVISSQNDITLKMSNKALRKEITKEIENLRKILLDLIAKIEVNIDYPEYDDAILMTNDIILPNLRHIKEHMDKILKHSKIGKTLSFGIDTAIIGKPNVGKSSLLNMLLEEEKAIVSSYAGTTRDIIEGKLNIGNVTLNLIDTAGIRESDDFVEKIGISKSKEALSKAELVLLVLDNSDITNYDKELLELTKDKPRIIILNKMDLDNKPNIEEDHIMISALNNEGLKELEEAILLKANIEDLNHIDGTYLTNARQISKLEEAYRSILDAISSSELLLPVDMVEIDIKKAWDNLGEIIGISDSDALINELFSKFCLGK